MRMADGKHVSQQTIYDIQSLFFFLFRHLSPKYDTLRKNRENFVIISS